MTHSFPTRRSSDRASDDEARVLPIQSKALSKRAPLPLGGSLDRLCSHWWVVTINANTASPTCFVLTLDEVKAAAHRGVNQAGTASYWLQPKSYALEEYREAWDRLGSPDALSEPASSRLEEHTSELQSLMRISYAVFCLKKQTKTTQKQQIHK